MKCDKRVQATLQLPETTARPSMDVTVKPNKTCKELAQAGNLPVTLDDTQPRRMT